MAQQQVEKMFSRGSRGALFCRFCLPHPPKATQQSSHPRWATLHEHSSIAILAHFASSIQSQAHTHTHPDRVAHRVNHPRIPSHPFHHYELFWGARAGKAAAGNIRILQLFISKTASDSRLPRPSQGKWLPAFVHFPARHFFLLLIFSSSFSRSATLRVICTPSVLLMSRAADDLSFGRALTPARLTVGPARWA